MQPDRPEAVGLWREAFYSMRRTIRIPADFCCGPILLKIRTFRLVF